MNIRRYINMILLKLSNKHNIFYMEKITYKEYKKYKTYIIKIDNITKEFRSEKELLIYLSKIK